MKIFTPLVLVLASALAGCARGDYINDHKWAVEAPKEVAKGSDLQFKVTLLNAEEKPEEGVDFHYQILWPGGTVQPLRHPGRTGEDQKRRASLQPGTAKVVVTCANKDGATVKVAEASVEVK